jgi:septum formation protein
MMLVLASQSAARRAMLDAAGVPYEALPAHVDEDAITSALIAENASPERIADALAEVKALKISRVPWCWGQTVWWSLAMAT